MNKTLVVWVLVVLGLLVSGGWVWLSQKSQKNLKPIVIGYMGPLEGDDSAFGYSVLRGVQLAKKELGADEVEIISEDSRCGAEKAKTAVSKLISKGAVAIIGDICSGASMAALPAANNAKVVIISAASTSPKLSLANDYFFRTIPADNLQGKFSAEELFKKGYRKLAVMYTNESYGKDFNEVITDKFMELGGKVVANIPFESTTIDLKNQITELKKSGADVVYLVSNSTVSSVAAVKAVRKLNPKLSIYGSEALNDEITLRDMGAAGEGLIITAVSTGSKAFKYAHKAEFGLEAGLYSPQGYDAFEALYEAISKGARNGEEIKRVLSKISFNGKSGKIMFDNFGDVAGNYELLIVKNQKVVPIDQEL